MLLKDYIKQACESLEAVYPALEARSVVNMYCREVLGVQSYTHIIEPDTVVPEDRLEGMLTGIALLSQGYPVQQVLGYARFCGRKFRVTPDVLIPRPETEMLVERALAVLPEGARVLDLCTGSGCIAWSISLGADAGDSARCKNPDATGGGDAGTGISGAEVAENAAVGMEVIGVDISKAALDIADSQFEGNSFPSSSSPRFLQADILVPGWWKTSGLQEHSFDLLLSNPPYIRESEKQRMQRNVLEHEPGLALFVPDRDPLVFYRAIAASASALLKNGGRGIVEINEDLGPETAAVFTDEGFSGAVVIKDFYGKNRFVEFCR